MVVENEPPAASALTAVERYHVLRDQIQHKDNLTTQRLSWLMASQAFLFTAYAIVMNGPERAMSPFAAAQQQWLINAIPALALASAVLIYVSMIKAALGFRRLSVRGLSKVSLEWTLVSLSYNLKRLFNLGAQLKAA